MPILLHIPATWMPQSFWPLFSSRYQTVPWWPSHLITMLFGSFQFRVSRWAWRTVVQCSMMVGVSCMTWGPAWEAGGVGERSCCSGPKWSWCELGQYPWISGLSVLKWMLKNSSWPSFSWCCTSAPYLPPNRRTPNPEICSIQSNPWANP